MGGPWGWGWAQCAQSLDVYNLSGEVGMRVTENNNHSDNSGDNRQVRVTEKPRSKYDGDNPDEDHDYDGDDDTDGDDGDNDGDNDDDDNRLMSLGSNGRPRGDAAHQFLSSSFAAIVMMVMMMTMTTMVRMKLMLMVMMTKMIIWDASLIDLLQFYSDHEVS